MPPSALRALLTGSIDYAGLFPPATLELEPAIRNYAADLRNEDAWMLSTFVLPVGKFADAAWFVSEFDAAHPFRVSALGPKTLNVIDFVEELRNARKGIREFVGESRGLVQVAQLEMPLPHQFEPATLAAAREILGGLDLAVFWEAAPAAAERTILFLAEEGASSKAKPFGFKLRTGGVTADAFPTSAEIATALIAAAKTDVPIKFTAGLHHPIRMFRDEVKAKMHGFLNVLGAGVLAREHHWDERQTAAMLDDEKSASFVFEGDRFRWREFEVANIEKSRAYVTSFGSCSFDEPREDLRALKLL